MKQDPELETTMKAHAAGILLGLIKACERRTGKAIELDRVRYLEILTSVVWETLHIADNALSKMPRGLRRAMRRNGGLCPRSNLCLPAMPELDGISVRHTLGKVGGMRVDVEVRIVAHEKPADADTRPMKVEILAPHDEPEHDATVSFKGMH